MSIGWEKYSTRTDSVRMLARNCSKLMLQLPGIAPSPAAAGGCCAAPPDCCCAAPPDCCCAAPDSPRWLLLLISQIWSSWLSLDEMAAGLLRLAGPGATCQQERLHGCHLDQIIFGFISTSDTQNTTGTDTMGITYLPPSFYVFRYYTNWHQPKSTYRNEKKALQKTGTGSKWIFQKRTRRKKLNDQFLQ